MDDQPQYGGLATRLAALQQLVSEGGLAPPSRQKALTPAASGSLALRTDSLEQTNGRRVAFHGEPERSERGGAVAGASSPPARQRYPILIGASKGQPAALLEAAIRLGLKDFGENRVQEAYEKWPALKTKYAGVRLHLIGPLQSNKAADAVALFDVIHSIDRVKIADALAAACERQGRRPDMLLQVNTGEEPQKAGVAPREAAALIAHCRALGLPVIGLMCVPPESDNPGPHFALLRNMANEFGLPHCSMGMSGDFETAIRLGATMVRVGTALFGARA